MSKEFISFNFATPEKQILKEEVVEEILCPSSKGELNLLPGHAPLITLLQPGTLSFKRQGVWKKMMVSWGYLEVHPGGGVRVLAETAETGEEISKAQAEKNIEELYKKLEDNLTTPEESRKLRKKIQEEEARIQLCSEGK